MEGGTVTTVVGVLVGLVTAVASAVGAYLGLRHRQQIELEKHRVEVERSVSAEYRVFIEGMQEELEVHRNSFSSLVEAIRVMSDEHTFCWVALASTYGYLREQHAHSQRAIAALKELGVQIDEGPKLPPDPTGEVNSRAKAAAEVVSRVLRQTVRSMQTIEKQQQQHGVGQSKRPSDVKPVVKDPS